jgi:predicted O-methyltransferase YrrM
VQLESAWRQHLLRLAAPKALYPEILSLAESRLRPDAFIVADNADYSPDYLALVRSPANGYMSVPFADDIELSMRTTLTPDLRAKVLNSLPSDEKGAL